MRGSSLALLLWLASCVAASMARQSLADNMAAATLTVTPGLDNATIFANPDRGWYRFEGTATSNWDPLSVSSLLSMQSSYEAFSLILRVYRFDVRRRGGSYVADARARLAHRACVRRSCIATVPCCRSRCWMQSPPTFKRCARRAALAWYKCATGACVMCADRERASAAAARCDRRCARRCGF